VWCSCADYTHDKHHTVDDAPYGWRGRWDGGCWKVESRMWRAVEDLKVLNGSPIVLLSASWQAVHARHGGQVFARERADAVVWALQGRRISASPEVLGAERDLDRRFRVIGRRAAALSVVDAVVRPVARRARGSRIGVERFRTMKDYWRRPATRGPPS